MRRAVRCACGIALVAVSLSCAGMPNRSGSMASSSRTHAAAVTGAAKHFAQLFQTGDYAAQWSLLSPIAQTQWPSNSYPDQSLYPTPYDYRLDYGLTVDPAEFSGQVDYLAQHGYKAISLDRLANYLLYGLPLPSKSVIFTFDDGRASPFQYAVPVLRQHGFTATFFVPSGLIGGSTRSQQYLTADQVAQLSQTGFWIEDHTVKDNIPLWGLDTGQVQAIAGNSMQQLQALTGMPVQFIAYTGIWPHPSATESGPAEHQLFDELQKLGYVGGLVDARQNSNLEDSTQFWQLPRIRVNPNESLSTFASFL